MKKIGVSIRLGIVVIVLGAGFATMSACHKSAQEKASTAFTTTGESVTVNPQSHSPVRFATVEATAGSPLPLPPFTGRVSTVEAATSPSFAPLAGRIVSVNVRLGEHVHEGDRLIEVRTADLPMMQHDLRAAQLAIKTRTTIVERLERLVEARAASQNDLTVAKSELDEAKLAAQAAGEKIRSLSIRASGSTSYWVLANRAGTVVQLDATVGQWVTPNTDKPIATVADLGEVLVLADVAQKSAPSIEPGQMAEIKLLYQTGATLGAKVESVSDVVDPERQTVPVRFRVKNDRKLLRPNAFVNVIMTPSHDGSLVSVPTASVVSDGSRSVVFVETAPGTFQRRIVDVGRQSKDRAEVISGLAPGERVVSTGALLLLNAIETEG